MEESSSAIRGKADLVNCHFLLQTVLMAFMVIIVWNSVVTVSMLPCVTKLMAIVVWDVI